MAALDDKGGDCKKLERDLCIDCVPLGE